MSEHETIIQNRNMQHGQVFTEEEKNDRETASLVPMQEERVLKKRTQYGYNLQHNYRTYSVAALKDCIDRGDYTVVGRTFKGSWVRNKKQNRHSPLLRQLVETIDSLQDILKERITPEDVDETIERMQNLYNRIFLHAYNYCVERNPGSKEGKARKDMVLLIRDQANEERMKLANNARAIADLAKNEPNKVYTYEDVIRRVRTRTIREGEGGVVSIKNGGKGTSDIYVVEKEDGSKMYIRPSENLKKDSVGARSFLKDTLREGMEYQERLAGELQKENLSEERRQELLQEQKNITEDQEIQNMLLRDLAQVKKENRPVIDAGILQMAFEKPATVVGMYSMYFRKDPLYKYGRGEIAKYIEEARKEPACVEYEKLALPLANVIASEKKKREDMIPYQPEMTEREREATEKLNPIQAEFNKKDTKLSRLIRALKVTGKHLNQRDFARDAAMIPDGENVSKRNVAVSILARTLGIRDMVAESEMVEVEINGKKIHGTLMEEAQGWDLRKYAKHAIRENKKAVYTAKALQQLSILQLFDLLCGQVDRKSDNYMSVVKTDKRTGISYIESIKAIDNDMSCGLLDYQNDIVNHSSEGLSNKRQQLPAITNRNGDLNVKVFDRPFCEKILALKPALIDFLMMGILSEAERNAMKKRLLDLQRIITRVFSSKACRKMIKNTILDWDDYREQFDREGAGAHTYFMDFFRDRSKVGKNP